MNTFKKSKICFIIGFVFLSFTYLFLKPAFIKQSPDLFKSNIQSNNVIYMVLTSENTITTRGIAIWNTWGKHCRNLLFTCNCKNVLKVRQLKQDNKEIPKNLSQFEKVIDLPVLDVNADENYYRMGKKVLDILELVYDRFKNMVNWYYMVDDDTYVYPYNLEKFIKTQDTSKPLYYGFKYTHVVKPDGYIGGGSGILFTNESMIRLVDKIKNHECDRFIDTYGDTTIGECARFANVSIGNSHDKHDKPRFHYFPPLTHFYGPLPSYLYKLGTHNKKIGKDCCSVESIGFHYVKPDMMYSIYANKTLLTDLFS